MTFWQFLGVALSSAGLFASILGAFLTYAARKNGEATRALVHGTQAETQALITRTQAETQALITSTQRETHALIQGIEERMTRHFSQLLDRMDQRADERHREVVELIKALRAA